MKVAIITDSGANLQKEFLASTRKSIRRSTKHRHKR